MSSYRRGGAAHQRGGRQFSETCQAGTGFSMDQDSFPGLPSARLNISAGSSTPSSMSPVNLSVNRNTSTPEAPKIKLESSPIVEPKIMPTPTPMPKADPDAELLPPATNNFPYAAGIQKSQMYIPPVPPSYPELPFIQPSAPLVNDKAGEQPMMFNNQMFPGQQQFFQPMFQPVMFDNNGATMAPTFYRFVAPGQQGGFLGPAQMWMPPAGAATPFEQQPLPFMPMPMSLNGPVVPKVDVCVDATTQMPQYMDHYTQTSPVKDKPDAAPVRSTKLIESFKRDSAALGKKILDADWQDPNAKSGEKWYGWTDSPAPEKIKPAPESQEDKSGSPKERKTRIAARRDRTRSPDKIQSAAVENNTPPAVEKVKEEPRPIPVLLTKGKNHSSVENQIHQEKPQSLGQSDQYGDSNASQRATEGGLDFKRINQQAEDFRRAEVAAMTPIMKDLYQEDASVAKLTEEDVEEIRDSMNISVHFPKPEELSPIFNVESGDKDYSHLSIPKPVTSFAQAYGMYPEIMAEVAKQGFEGPTPIQCQLWPCIMKGHDVVGIAQTGSGKTLGFLLPAFIHIEKQIKPRNERISPTVLILAPTRELAQQIHVEVSKYSYKGIKSVCLYGGNPKSEQIDLLRGKPEIVIATAGRLNDLITSDDLNLKEVSLLVLDEADEMLDQGFEPQINRALMRVRCDRQTILTSATWPQSVRRMAKNYTKDPIMVVVGTVELRAVKSVTQNVVFLAEEEKYNWLIEFLKTRMNDGEKLIVFVGKKSFADHLSSELSLMNLNCVCIHGGLPQTDRERAIVDMKSGDSRVLIASDVVARGIDIENISYIINYDMPKNSEMYIHRIGRTGRAGRTGESFTLVTRRDWAKAQDLVDILTTAGQEVPEELVTMAQRFKNRPDRGNQPYRGRGGRGGGGGGFQGEGGYQSNSYSNSYGGGGGGFGSSRGNSYGQEGGYSRGGGYSQERGNNNRGGGGYGNYQETREFNRGGYGRGRDSHY